jgi:hypothetical protein
MTNFELLSILLAIVAAVTSLVALIRAREVASRQIELQERQLSLERESAKLARLQREQLEAAKNFPALHTSTFAVKIHYDDATIDDTVVELTFENASSINRSINSCTVGVLEKPTDLMPKGVREAQYRDENATYPISIPAHSSLKLYSFARHIRPLFENLFGSTSTDIGTVVVVAQIAGMPEPLVRFVASYSLAHGFSAIAA